MQLAYILFIIISISMPSQVFLCMPPNSAQWSNLYKSTKAVNLDSQVQGLMGPAWTRESESTFEGLTWTRLGGHPEQFFWPALYCSDLHKVGLVLKLGSPSIGLASTHESKGGESTSPKSGTRSSSKVYRFIDRFNEKLSFIHKMRKHPRCPGDKGNNSVMAALDNFCHISLW